MNYKNVAIVLAIVMMASVPIGMMGLSDDSDAYVEMEMEKVTGSGFTNNGNGTISVPLKNYENRDIEITVRVMYTSGSQILGETTVIVPAISDGDPGTAVARISFNIPDVGEHQLKVICEPKDYFPSSGGQTFNETKVIVEVTESLWSKWTTYAAVALVIILIVIAVMVKMRSAPSKKPTTSFTELEKQRASGSETKQMSPAQPATERRRYTASSPDKTTKVHEKEPPAQKATTFTDLDKEKSAPKPEKPAKQEKVASSEEPKKIKYVSSRRK